MRPAIIFTVLIAAFFATATPRCEAQATAQPETYRWDLGAGLGMAGYLGDANESKLFSHLSLGANISLRYLLNTRFALRALLNYVSLSGNTADMDNVLPYVEPFSFKSTLLDLQARGEFNFFSYGIGEDYKHLSRFSPYLALGIGVSRSSCDDGSAVAMTIPMAFGIKFKLKPRLNLGLEFAMTKLLGDNLDGYKLSDPYQIKSSFLKNTDWYSTLLFSVSYEFGERCIQCNRLD